MALRNQNARLRRGAAILNNYLQDIFSGTWTCDPKLPKGHDSCLNHCIEFGILDAQKRADIDDLLPEYGEEPPAPSNAAGSVPG